MNATTRQRLTDQLRPRDLHLALLIVSGASRQAIAKELGIHPVSVSRLKRRTIQEFVRRLYMDLTGEVLQVQKSRFVGLGKSNGAASATPGSLSQLLNLRERLQRKTASAPGHTDEAQGGDEQAEEE